jgi:hypothetical protein
VWKQARAQPAEVKVTEQKTPYIVHAPKKYSKTNGRRGPPIDKLPTPGMQTAAADGRDILVSLDFQLLILPMRTPTTKPLLNKNYLLV